MHDGVTIDTCDAYDARLRVQRMGLTELGKRFAVNTEYLDEMAACITSIDALGRLKVVQAGLSRLVHAAMAAYMKDQIKFFTGKYVSVCVCTGRDGKKQFSSHHVIWSDRTFFGRCELVLSCHVGSLMGDTEEYNFKYWDPWWRGALEYHGADAGALPHTRRLRRNVTDEDQRRMVQVHMDYLMGKIIDLLVDDFYAHLQELDVRKVKRSHARAKARFLADNQGTLTALCNS